MRSYFQVRLGKANIYADECARDGYIGTSWFANNDLTLPLNDAADWRTFNKKMIPLYLESSPETTKIAAGLFCGFTYTVGKTLQRGDVVLSPIGDGKYLVGEISGGYHYVAGADIPHRRRINWYKNYLDSTDFTSGLKTPTGSIGTVANLSKYSVELDSLIAGNSSIRVTVNCEDVEDTSVFALEEHLENFLIADWGSTELSKQYDIFEVDGLLVGKQYPTDTGLIDILAISKDKKKILVIELERGRDSDRVVGQTQRYMRFVQDELAEEGQKARGAIIGLDKGLELRRALSRTQGIDFYRYEVSFKLQKGFKEKPLIPLTPLFVYGSLKPGEIGYEQIAEMVSDFKDAEISGYSLYIRDGLPIIKDSDNLSSTVKGVLLTPNKQNIESFWKTINDYEGTSNYRRFDGAEVMIGSERVSASVFVGRKMEKSNPEPLKIPWTSKLDPIFAHSFPLTHQKICSTQLGFSDAEHNSLNYWKQINELLGQYLLLVSILEHLTVLKYGGAKGQDPMIRIQKLQDSVSNSGIIQTLIDDGYIPAFGVRDSRDVEQGLSSTNPDKTLLAWYQVRSNLQHRGKSSTRDADFVQKACIGLTNFLMSYLKNEISGIEVVWEEILGEKIVFAKLQDGFN